MTISIKLNLDRPAEMEAFGVFCASVAAARRAEPPRRSVYDLLGGISRETGGWKSYTGSGPAKPGSDETVVMAKTDEQPVEEDPNQVIAETNFAPTGAAKPTRERGKPSPGHKRRTNAEIAEDDAVPLTVASMTILPDDSTPEQVAEAFAGLKGGVEDSPEVQAADAADEAAETAAAKAPDAAPTVEAIRDVLGLYQKVYGLPATMTDGPAILQEVCGEGVVKVSAVPDDKIASVIAALKKAGNENRFGRTAVAS